MLSVLPSDDPLLRTVCPPLSRRDLRTTICQDEIESLLNYVFSHVNKGETRDRTKPTTVGLSANQVGIGKRVSIVDLGIGHKRFHDVHILINPEVLWHSKTVTDHIEGCVNFPSIWGVVPRFQRVRVTALDRSGNALELSLTGWAARLLQHEIDHLNGILFIDRLADPTKAHFVEKADYAKYKKEKDTWQKFIDVSHLVKPLNSQCK